MLNLGWMLMDRNLAQLAAVHERPMPQTGTSVTLDGKDVYLAALMHP